MERVKHQVSVEQSGVIDAELSQAVDLELALK